MWRPVAGPQSLLQWTEPTNCSFAVTSLSDFKRAFAGRRLVFVGDSTNRRGLWELMDLVYSCPHADGRVGVDALRAAWAQTLTSPAAAAHAAAMCVRSRGPNDGHAWVDAEFELPSFPGDAEYTTGLAPVQLTTRWAPFMEDIPTTRWWQEMTNATVWAAAAAANGSVVSGPPPLPPRLPDALLLGSYVWYPFGVTRAGTSDPGVITRAAAALVAAVLAADNARDLAARTWFRTPPVVEQPPSGPGGTLYAVNKCLDAMAACGAAFVGAGMRVLDLTGYSRAQACADEPGGWCTQRVLTDDGHHLRPYIATWLAQAALSYLADHLPPLPAPAAAARNLRDSDYYRDRAAAAAAAGGSSRADDTGYR